MTGKGHRVVFWGTYDKGKPRNRLLLAGARIAGLDVVECNSEIWAGVEDKSQISGLGPKVRRVLRWLFAYPSLIWRYLRLPPHDVAVVAYMGQIDVIVLWPFARLRGVRICWDVFISLYDTLVVDRRLAGRKSTIALFLYALEWLASRAADKIVIDSGTHAAYFEELYRLPTGSVGRVLVGAELDVFKPVPARATMDDLFTVLFYGQFIALHGLDTIVHAAKILEESGEQVRWIIIGQGQEQPRIDSLIMSLGLKSVDRIPWVEYRLLPEHIGRADVCLGIFNPSGKATRVVPNKVYQILACGKPLITGDTPAVREVLEDGPFVKLVRPGDPRELAGAVLGMKAERRQLGLATEALRRYVVGPDEVGRQLSEIIGVLTDGSGRLPKAEKSPH